MRHLVLLEQFLQALPSDMAVWIQEEKPKSMKEASKMADNYELTHKAEAGQPTLGSTKIHSTSTQQTWILGPIPQQAYSCS